MPEGMKGFQPGRPKTGGRPKGSVAVARKSTKFAERLKGYGFNYDSELAAALKELKNLRNMISGDPTKVVEEKKKIEELKAYYLELKSLLPYMTPKLKEKEVLASDDSEDPAAPPQQPISDEEALKALGDGKETDDNARTSSQGVLAARDSKLQVPSSSEEDLSNMVGVEEEDE